MIRRALLAPLRASTYRRAVPAARRGALLPYLLFVVLGRLLLTTPDQGFITP
jgi:hypothetical protein